MSKKLDMSVLPDGFLVDVQVFHDNWLQACKAKNCRFSVFRPAINYWHFNDGSMALPDGLVVEVMDWTRCKSRHVTFQGHIEDLPIDSMPNIMAVKILGVTEEYADDGARYGMEVV